MITINWQLCLQMRREYARWTESGVRRGAARTPPARTGASSCIRSLVCLATILVLPLSSLADDIGLVTAKLIESPDNKYVIEADVTPQIGAMLYRPGLPEGFALKSQGVEQRGALVNVRYAFTGPRPLAPGDVVMLPWGRSGVLLHASWVDGSSSSKLFLLGLGGIPIEISQIRSLHKSQLQQFYDSFGEGLRMVALDWRLYLPLLGIALLFSRRLATRYLWMLYAGMMLALLVLDFLPLEIAPVIAVCLMLVAALMAARSPGSKQLAPIFVLVALILGISGASGLAPAPRLARTLAFLLFYGIGGGLLIAVSSLLPEKKLVRTVAVLIGGAAVAGLLLTVLSPAPVEDKPQALILPQRPPTSQVKQVARKLSEPVAMFVSIEPYEVRCEIMVTGETAVQLINASLVDPLWIEQEQQDDFKQQAVEVLESCFSISFDGTPAEPALRRSDFLTLGTAGAFTRTDAVRESVQDAIVGLTYVYTRTGPPETMQLTWNKLPLPGTPLPATIIDPSGNRGFTFSEEALAMEWSNESRALKPVELEAVVVMRPTWAILSVLLVLGAAATMRKPKSACTCLVLALIAFPLVRVPIPFGSPLREVQAEVVVEQLLSNVYRSFDFRDESEIYDQLAISVCGDQLSDIYLSQRRALELQNRGGARAKVETVEVKSIDSVKSVESGVAVAARWNVSGSVNHFGHTHYRQNAYNATLLLVRADELWKIAGIEVHEEERIY
jgi:hypothetical protein